MENARIVAGLVYVMNAEVRASVEIPAGMDIIAVMSARNATARVNARRVAGLDLVACGR